MGIETAIALGIGGLVGGTISKASGGSFWKGAALGSLTGGIGTGIDRLTGGHLTNKSTSVGGITYATGVSNTSSSDSTGENKNRSLALFNTGVSGVLGNATTGRRTLLGN